MLNLSFKNDNQDINNNKVQKNKRDKDRKIKPGYNVEFGSPSTLHEPHSPPIKNFTTFYFIINLCPLGAYANASRLTRRFPQ